MTWEMRDGQGSLFKNDKKESDKHPNATGDAMIGGVIYRVAAWTKTDKNGNKFQSLSFKPKEEMPAKKEAPKASAFEDVDSDLPF